MDPLIAELCATTSDALALYRRTQAVIASGAITSPEQLAQLRQAAQTAVPGLLALSRRFSAEGEAIRSRVPLAEDPAPALELLRAIQDSWLAIALTRDVAALASAPIADAAELERLEREAAGLLRR